MKGSTGKKRNGIKALSLKNHLCFKEETYTEEENMVSTSSVFIDLSSFEVEFEEELE